MLITFKSRAAADVIMFGDVASRMLEVMGKDPAEVRGILTVEQLPQAIEKLRAAIAADKTRPNDDAADNNSDEATRGMAAKVSFAQRAVPISELLSLALRDGEPVIWEG